MDSTTGEPFTLTFAAFNMSHCFGLDLVLINDGTSTQRYCGDTRHNGPPIRVYCCPPCDYCGSTPGPVTGTTITVKLHTSQKYTASGFFAVVTGDATVTTDVTGESEVNVSLK